MESAKSLCKKLLNFKNTVITGCEFYTDTDNVNHIRIRARPDKRHENKCPYCRNRCPGYDSRCGKPRIWRGLDWGSTLVEIEYRTHRIACPEHGVVVADVPWAYPGSGFTKDFDLTVAWFAVYCKHFLLPIKMDFCSLQRLYSQKPFFLLRKLEQVAV